MLIFFLDFNFGAHNKFMLTQRQRLVKTNRGQSKGGSGEKLKNNCTNNK